VNLPFLCNYCGGFYCAEHRLPEYHSCSALGTLQRPVIEGRITSIPFEAPSFERRRLRPSASSRELRDLGIALGVLMLVGLSWQRFIFALSPLMLLGVALGVAPAFLLHEVMHKLTAQRFGAWAEFRLDPFGMMITVISIFSPFFKVIAPGAVMISGYHLTREDMGKIALAGPLTNITLAMVLLALPFHHWIINLAVTFNLFIAFFNLLPFSILDGRKIISWNKLAWAAAFALTVFLFAARAFVF
jgi:Zn-dependent protease